MSTKYPQHIVLTTYCLLDSSIFFLLKLNFNAVKSVVDMYLFDGYNIFIFNTHVFLNIMYQINFMSEVMYIVLFLVIYNIT